MLQNLPFFLFNIFMSSSATETRKTPAVKKTPTAVHVQHFVFLASVAAHETRAAARSRVISAGCRGG